MYAKLLFFNLLLIIVSNSAFSQSFYWCNSGFNDSSIGGLFNNLNGTNIDLEIGGLFDARCYSVDSNSIRTGINNSAAQGVQHTYTFKYSEPVDINFIVDNITYDTTDSHDDFLVFSGNPVFSEMYEVIVSGDSVYRNIPSFSLAGSIRVTYTQTDSFSITHGRGSGFNPGFIIIGPLQGAINSSVNKDQDINFRLFPNPNNGVFTISLSESNDYEIKILNISGQIMLESSYSNTNLIKIDMGSVPKGFYIYQMYKNKKIISMDKFCVF